MSGWWGRRAAVRVAAVTMAGLLAAAGTLTYLSYQGAFIPTGVVTLDAPRAGLVMERDAKVKFLGVQIGKVADISYEDDSARLVLAIRRDEFAKVPANITARIASNTIFGAKSVDFLAPEEPAQIRLAPGAHLLASDVSVEINTLFQTLIETLRKVNPVQLNTTLTALGDALRGNGDDVGEAVMSLGELLRKVNPKLPALHEDIRRADTTAEIYAGAADDVITTLANVPTVSRTVVERRDDLSATLMAAAGVADAGIQTLRPAENDLIAAIQRLRAPLRVAGEYSPEYGCLITALAKAYKKFGPNIGGIEPALFVNAGFIPGSPAYTYPESLPIVNASGGPNCRGLPDLPTKQGSGSWYRPPFLVTDNAYVPYLPNTELQFDPPSTLQFLFNGAYAEQDEY